MKRISSGGGWPAIRYAWNKGREAGGVLKLYRALRTRNACKTCALGMGGQKGGMVNEAGHFPEVCKKSIQAVVADLQPAIGDHFWDQHSLADLRQLSPRNLEGAGRLVEPMLLSRGDTHYRPISWENAFDRVATALQAADPQETFFYFSGRSSNEAGFLLQLMARLYGTNNINNCSYYCHQASGVGLTSVTGSGTATVVLDDLEAADLVFLIGGNPASNHPRLMRHLMHVRRRGGQVVVINPVVETGLVRFRVPSDLRSLLGGTAIASHYVQPHIGGDLALLTGVAKRIVELGFHDQPFLQQSCTGWTQLETALANCAWEDIEAKSGVSTSEIDRLAKIYAGAENVIFAWTMGITHHAHGVQNVQAIANLALMRGMVGRPQAGLLPIRGHSNVQGIGSMGVTPQLKEAVFTALQSELGIQLPTTPGLDTLGCIEAAAEGQMKVGVCLGGNLFGSNPDATFASTALGRLETLVYLNTTLNTGHAHGVAAETLLLPVAARDEEPQPTTQESMFNYVRLSDGGPSRHPNTRSEVSIIADLAAAVLGDDTPIDWNAMRATRSIRRTIAQVVPGFEALANIDDTQQEFQISGRTFHRPQFATDDGRAHLHTHALPPLPGEGRQLRLMTVRSEGQFNTVVYEEHDLYRGVEGRDVILIHPDDLSRLGLSDGASVSVRSQTGQLDAIRIVSYADIKPGNALMYYPEANVLVSRQADPLSKTPAFKGVLVEIL